MTLSQRTLAFSAFIGAVSVLQWQTVVALYHHSQVDNTASHIVLVPLISCGLIVLRKRRIFTKLSTAWGASLPLLILAMGLLFWPTTLYPNLQPGHSLTIAVMPMVVLWIAGFVLFYGLDAARAARFPLLFLVLVAPFPPMVLEWANDFLKNGSTAVVAGLFELANTPHYREGYVFRLPYLAIEIADACSGIRSSIGLLVTTLLAGHMFLSSTWRKVVLILCVVPITVVKNGIRIAVLSWLTVYVDPGYMTGQLHHEGGIVFFALSLAMLSPVLAILVRCEAERPTSQESRYGRVDEKGVANGSIG
jgi:exosortase